MKNTRLVRNIAGFFNNSSFAEGGRFHGHWSQYIKSCFRQDIMIDGKCTAELDYSCLHIFMLYCLEGIQPPSGDLYNLKGISPGFRPLIKIAVNIALNAENETVAKQAIHKEIIEMQKKSPATFFPSPTTIIDAIRSTHPLISKYICTGMGIKLQNMDSQIAEKILLNGHISGPSGNLNDPLALGLYIGALLFWQARKQMCDVRCEKQLFVYSLQSPR